MKPVTPPLAAQAWEAMFRAQVELLRRFEGDSIFNDVTFKEYDVLFTLRSGPKGGMRLKDLNRAVLLHQSALSRLVERLEQRGLVLRCADKSDGRGTMIQLTEQGLATQREIGRKHVGQMMAYVGGALTAQELEQLAAIASKLRHQQPHIPSIKESHNES